MRTHCLAQSEHSCGKEGIGLVLKLHSFSLIRAFTWIYEAVTGIDRKGKSYEGNYIYFCYETKYTNGRKVFIQNKFFMPLNL